MAKEFVAVIFKAVHSPRGSDVMPRSKNNKGDGQKALRSANKHYPDFPLKQSPLCFHPVDAD